MLYSTCNGAETVQHCSRLRGVAHQTDLFAQFGRVSFRAGFARYYISALAVTPFPVVRWYFVLHKRGGLTSGSTRKFYKHCTVVIYGAASVHTINQASLYVFVGDIYPR